MGKQSKARKPENIGKGKVTPVQIAFIVDRFLSDNNYVKTRSTFRIEASYLISKSPVQEAPKSLLSLGAMLDEYICLKEEKVILNQEKYCLEQEKVRVQTLLKGMQDVMNDYNSSGESATASLLPSMPNPPAKVPQVDLIAASPAASHPVYNTPVMTSTSRLSKTSAAEPTNFLTPVTNQPTSKRRRNSKDVSGAPLNSKKSQSHPSANKLQAAATTTLRQQSNASNNQEASQQFSVVPSASHVVPNGLPVQGSSVAKRLFNQPSQSPPNSSGPQTPSPSQNDKSLSPMEIPTPTSSNNVTVTVTPQQQFTSTTNCTVISSETITVSPSKQILYYSIERNHCVSSSPIKTNLKRFGKRDHVKGRLDFDGSDNATTNTEKSVPGEIVGSQPEKQGDIFDFDLPNLDALGIDFCLTDLLGDLDFDGDYYCQPATGSSPESLSGSPDVSENANIGEQVLSGYSSTVTEVLSENDMNIPAGPDSVTSVTSMTKCIKIISPVKNQRSTVQYLENCSTRD